VTEPSQAVFLSYASQDQKAAQRICEKLRAAGIEVWFDQSELRGGDAWDRKIREQIHDCRLFMPVISANSERRDEGYFRREWNLAVERSRDMAHKRAFLVPVVIDGTHERGASVPEKFHELQWTRLPGGETPPAFVERVQRLLSPEAPSARAALPPVSTTVPPGRSVPSPWRFKRAGLWVVSAVLAAALVYIFVDKLLAPRPLPLPTASTAVPTQTVAPTPASAPAFNPPPHSIAVLPFVNMSGDKEQEYFSDGLTEELLNTLSRINDLQVAARTSAFSFKGKEVKIGTVARELNVAAVLEGSVRRSGHTVRVSAQLINARTGFHLWSETYDRDLSDVLKLQTEIANAVANALRVTLLRDLTAKIEVGGTQNPAALDAYFRGSRIYWLHPSWTSADEMDRQAVLAAYSEAIRQDPGYALAYASRSLALNTFAGGAHGLWPRETTLSKAQMDARKAIALAPDLAEGHLALANYFESSLEFTPALQEYAQSVALAPGNARVLRDYGFYAVKMGQTDQGLAAGRRSVVLDPLNALNHSFLGQSLVLARRYVEAISVLKDAKALSQVDLSINEWLYYAYYLIGNLESARASCDSAGEESKLLCLAITYDKLGRHADAEQMLGKLKAAMGDAWAYQYAEIYAPWGDTTKALAWLETAVRLRDSNLQYLKTDPLLDTLRHEPRFLTIERGLNFPN
jgi:TolB-like protein/tetratricopeptide (TPR) repeat protein